LYLSTVSVSRFTKKNSLIFLFLTAVLWYARFEIPPGLDGGVTKQKRPSPRGLLAQASSGGQPFYTDPILQKIAKWGPL